MLFRSGFASHGRYRGMAPGAAIYAIKVLDRMGKGNTRLVVSALKWLISNYEKMNIRILNISVGMLASARREEQEELLAAIEAVWDAGIVVVAAAGNNGPKDKSITIPGLCRKIITVGSSDDEEGEVKNLGLMWVAIEATTLISALLSGFMQHQFSGPWFGGLSGVVYALMGYVWLRGERDPQSGIYLQRGLILFSLVWLIAGWFDVFGMAIANGAHVAGLATGLAMAFVDTQHVRKRT